MKTHVIDGKTYVEVERKGKVGEKVIIVNAWDTGGMYANGSVVTAEKIDDRGIYSEQVCTGEEGGNCGGFIADREYRVLVEIDEESAAPANNDDLIANLVRRVHSLERQVDSLSTQLRDTQRNVERQGVEIAEVTEGVRIVEELAVMTSKDVGDIEERLDSVGNTERSGAKLLAEAFEALAKYERSVR